MLSQEDQHLIHNEDERGGPESSTNGGCSEGEGDRHGGPLVALQLDRAPQLLRE